MYGDNGKGAPAEAIVNDMISENRCDVDTVTGATCSSIVIKSAVHNALVQGILNKINATEQIIIQK